MILHFNVIKNFPILNYIISYEKVKGYFRLNINQIVMFKICVHGNIRRLYGMYVYTILWRSIVFWLPNKKKTENNESNFALVYSNIIKTFDWKHNNIGKWRKQSSANLNGSIVHLLCRSECGEQRAMVVGHRNQEHTKLFRIRWHDCIMLKLTEIVVLFD